MINEFVLNWFENNSSLARENIRTDVNFLEAGYIDSLGFLGLIADCESKYAISFEDKEFESMELLSIDGIVLSIQLHVGDKK